MRRIAFLLYIFIATSVQMVTARPNWGDITDGVRVYSIEGSDDDCRWTFNCFSTQTDPNNYYISLEGKDDKFVIRDVEKDYPTLKLPKPYTAGDSVIYIPEMGAYFFNAQGRLYASMRPYRSYMGHEHLMRNDSLNIVGGFYTCPGEDKGVSLFFDNDRQPTISVDYGDNERISFQPDVVVNGKALMHIQTPKRRWLLEFTVEGLNIYAAVRQQGKKGYQKGKLLRRAHFDENPYSSDGLRFDYNQGLPFIQLLDRYVTVKEITALHEQLAKAPENSCTTFMAMITALWAKGRNK